MRVSYFARYRRADLVQSVVKHCGLSEDEDLESYRVRVINKLIKIDGGSRFSVYPPLG